MYYSRIYIINFYEVHIYNNETQGKYILQNKILHIIQDTIYYNQQYTIMIEWSGGNDDSRKPPQKNS